jgi:hypothetical protein
VLEFIEKGKVSVTDEPDLNTELIDKQMIALELCPAGDMFNLVTDHKEMLAEN